MKNCELPSPDSATACADGTALEGTSEAFARHDSRGSIQALGVSGPMLTNVNDFRTILIE